MKVWGIFKSRFGTFWCLDCFSKRFEKSFMASALPRFSSRWFVYKTNDSHATQKSSTFSKPLSLSFLDELQLSLAPALRYLACFKQNTNLVCFWKKIKEKIEKNESWLFCAGPKPNQAMTPGEGWLSRFPEDLLTHLLDSPALGRDIRLAALRPDGQAWSTTGFSRLVLAALAPWLTDALLNRYSQYLATNSVWPFRVTFYW